jgi:hypothetical protein
LWDIEEDFMINTILTPTVIWKNFALPDTICAQILNIETTAGFTTSKLIFEGRKVKDGAVKIYAELSRDEKLESCPVVLLLEDFSINQDKTLANDLLKKGFAVLTVDLAGKMEDKEFFTSYPESLNYANYENAKDELYTVKSNAKSTCW